MACEFPSKSVHNARHPVVFVSDNILTGVSGILIYYQLDAPSYQKLQLSWHQLNTRPSANITPHLMWLWLHILRLWNIVEIPRKIRKYRSNSWWRHQLETFSALLAFCVGNSPVIGEFPAQRPVTRSFDVFFDLGLNKCLNNNREVGDLRRHRTYYADIVTWCTDSFVDSIIRSRGIDHIEAGRKKCVIFLRRLQINFLHRNSLYFDSFFGGVCSVIFCYNQ